MTKLNRLKLEALEACKWRGHTMQRFQNLTKDHAFTRCDKCHTTVDVLTKPAPNEIDIGGEAVALNCR